jgi:hypothetical protein
VAKPVERDGDWDLLMRMGMVLRVKRGEREERVTTRREMVTGTVVARLDTQGSPGYNRPISCPKARKLPVY